MAKVPVAGRVKTRLARQVGAAEAIRFYRATMGAVVGRLGRQPFWETYLSVSPDAGVCSGALPLGVRRIVQGGGDLGARMQRPMRELPPGPVCLIGTDIPAVQVADIRRAFRALGRADAVFGPADDGGFWLVGLRRRPRLIWPYTDVAWSMSDTLARVLGNLEGARVGFTATLSDVDGAPDLAAGGRDHGRRVRPVARREGCGVG